MSVFWVNEVAVRSVTVFLTFPPPQPTRFADQFAYAAPVRNGKIIRRHPWGRRTDVLLAVLAAAVAAAVLFVAFYR